MSFAASRESLQNIVIYHGNCADGFGAAWAIHKVFPYWEFVAGVYQNPPPDVAGKKVWLVDFSYKSQVVREMAAVADSITLLDHHKSAIDDLRPLLEEGLVQGEVDVDRSGAMITWEQFHHEPPPPLLSRIQDRDLWKFSYPDSRAVAAALFSYPYDFQVWDELMRRPLEELATEGRAIERKHFKDIHELISIGRIMAPIGGHLVPTLNCPYFFSSDAGHIMAQGYPFAACWYDTIEGRNYSLRSADDGIDVSDIAKKFGGGGHKHAAGFRIPHGAVPT